MTHTLLSKLAIVFMALLLVATNIFAILHNDMVVEYTTSENSTPAPPDTQITPGPLLNEPPVQAAVVPDAKQPSSDQIENDLSSLKTTATTTTVDGSKESATQPVLQDPGRTQVADDKAEADETIFATITIQVPAAVAEQKIEPAAAEAAAAADLVNQSAGSNRTDETSTPAPFVVVNKADMQSFEEWKEMRLKDAAQLKDKQQQQQQQASVNNMSSQQAAAAAAAGTGTSSQSGQTKPDKSAQEPSSSATKKPNGGEADSSGILHRRKNYASADCGAKIIASNPEANNPFHVLSDSKDDYMLNSCKSNIWFVVELCEPVKINELEIANLELFSNVPRQFNVYASERFPQTSNGKEWQSKFKLGTFEAANTRSIQRFSIHSDKGAQGDSAQGQDKEAGSSSTSSSQQLPNVIMFSKYVRFEMLSHYGTEHYCPLSVVRIYGTSMADEEEVMQTNEIDEDVHAHHQLTLNAEGIKAPAPDNGDNIKILINENDLKTEPVSPANVPLAPNPTPVDGDRKPAKKFLGSLQSSLINSIISIFPYENFNITKLFGSLTGNRNYFGRAEPDSNVASKAANMGKPTKSTIIMENKTSSRHTANKSSPSPTSIRPAETAFVPVVLTNYMFKNKEERDRAVTLQIDLHKLLCSSSRFGSSAIRLDQDANIDCCQCLSLSLNLTLQRLKTSLVTKYCGYYFLMMTSAQSRSQNSLLSKYAMNTHLSPPSSSGANEANSSQGDSPGAAQFTRISINNINYYILNELLDNRTELAPNEVVAQAPAAPGPSDLKSPPAAEDRPSEPLAPQQQVSELNLSEKNESKNSEEEEKIRYTNLTTNESDLLDRDPSKGTDSSMGKFNLESERNRHQQQLQQPLKEMPRGAQTNASHQEPEPVKAAEADSPDGPETAPEVTDIESALKAEEPGEPVANSQGEPDRSQQPPATSQMPRVTPPIVIGNGKEALIMRLTNRIKMLELNMTLSSQYLEKLSQHYKKQMDEMQRAFNLTSSALKNATRIADERELKLQERIALVEKRLENTQTFIDSLNLYMIELKFETDLIMFGGIVFVVVIIILELIRCMRHVLVPKPGVQTTGSREVDITADRAPPPPAFNQRDLENMISRQVELYFEKQGAGLQFKSNETAAATHHFHQLETIGQEHVCDRYEERPAYDAASDSVDKQVTTAAAVVSSTLTAVVAAVSLAAAAKASCAKLSSASEEIDT